MPPRSVTLAILAFWLATLGWFCHHELWPRLRPGQKPPYTIDLAQEVSGSGGQRHWEIFYNGITIGTATTWVGHRRDDDTYELNTHCFFHKFGFPVNVPLVGRLGDLDVQTMESMYRVTRDGDLCEVDADVVAAFRALPAREHRGADGEPEVRPPDPAAAIKGHVKGAVKDGTFAPLWRVESPLVGRQELHSDPVEVATGHSMLSPLQPWNRLLDVQEDKRWHIRLFDPLMDSVGTLLPGNARAVRVRELEAGVLQGTQDLTWNNAEVPCLVIEYRGDDITGRTYVRKSDGLVLRQEMTRQDHRLALERMSR
jgi:hypothetical protein